jgi:hypothetical protein
VQQQALAVLRRAKDAAQNAFETRPFVQADFTAAKSVFDAARGACDEAKVLFDAATAEYRRIQNPVN